MQEPQTERPARADALRRVRSVKRWVVGGALTLTGVFSAVAAHALPASHSKSQPPTPTSTRTDPERDSVAPQSTSPDVSPPVQAPQPSSSHPGTVSGGS